MIKELKSKKFILKDESQGIIYEIYRLKNGCLECYVYLKNREYEKNLFIQSANPIDVNFFLKYCKFTLKNI